ncbi:tetratricopeptide repeat protein [Streptomyces sp. Pv4-95]|uniref:tetratricopeptide repeat protein n=1 Tax=Streptomyces sp. Pv4-95 TaxID=3049543 RepID=UPI00389226B9
MPEHSPETHVIDFRAAEQLLAARDPRGAIRLLDSVIAAHPENTAARLLRARAFFLAAQLRPAELEFQIVLEREPDNAFAHFALGRTLERANRSEESLRHFRLAAALEPRPEFIEAARFAHDGANGYGDDNGHGGDDGQARDDNGHNGPGQGPR